MFFTNPRRSLWVLRIVWKQETTNRNLVYYWTLTKCDRKFFFRAIWIFTDSLPSVFDISNFSNAVSKLLSFEKHRIRSVSKFHALNQFVGEKLFDRVGNITPIRSYRFRNDELIQRKHCGNYACVNCLDSNSRQRNNYCSRTPKWKCCLLNTRLGPIIFLPLM